MLSPENIQLIRDKSSTKSRKLGDKTALTDQNANHYDMMHETYPQDFGKIETYLDTSPNLLNVDKILQTDLNTGYEYHDIELLYQSNPTSTIPTGTIFVNDIPFFRSRRREITTIKGKQIIEFKLSDILKYLYDVGYKSIIIIDLSCSNIDDHPHESGRGIIARSKMTRKGGRRKFRKSRRINSKKPKKIQRRSYRRPHRRYISY